MIAPERSFPRQSRRGLNHSADPMESYLEHTRSGGIRMKEKRFYFCENVCSEVRPVATAWQSAGRIEILQLSDTSFSMTQTRFIFPPHDIVYSLELRSVGESYHIPRMRTTLFLGAPLASSLDWAEASLRPLGDWENTAVQITSREGEEFSTGYDLPQWRMVKPNDRHLESSMIRRRSYPLWKDFDYYRATRPSQQNDLYKANKQLENSTVLDETSRAYLKETGQILTSPVNDTSNYLDASFAIHESLLPRSFDETSTLDSLPDSYEHPPQQLVSDLSKDEITATIVTKLKDLPSAKYLSSIAPQTITINVVVGIISIPLPKTVITGRRWGCERQIDVVELLVGDDTRTAFQINLWLPRGPENDGQQTKQSLQKLRSHDIILIRSLALGSFRGTVTGSSLRRDTTRIDLLVGLRPEPEACTGVLSHEILSTVKTILDKSEVVRNAKKVKEWLAHFVGDCSNAGSERRRKRTLPPDTQ